MKQIIRKVWRNKRTRQNLITIPKDSDIEEGDYVEVRKMEMKYAKEETKYEEVY